MTKELFRDLVHEFAGVAQADISYLQLREQYGFCDVPQSRVENVVGSLNGIEYNGQVLNVEIATPLRSENDSRAEGQARHGRSQRYGEGSARDGGRGRGDGRRGNYGGERRGRDDGPRRDRY